MSTIDFDPKDLTGNPLNEIPHKIIYLCPKYINAETPDTYREWMLAIEDSLDGEIEESNYHHPEIIRMFDHIEKDRISPHERALMIEEYNEDDLRQVFFERGIVKGIEQGKVETDKKMLSAGMDASLVSEVTGLSQDQVAKLIPNVP